MTQRVASRRKAPFSWSSNDAIDAITDHCEGRELNTALGIYQGLTRLASDNRDGDHEGFEATRAEIYRRCGVTGNTFNEYLKVFKRLGLIEVEVGGGSDANTWILTDPPAVVGPPQQQGGASDSGDPGSTGGAAPPPGNGGGPGTNQALEEEQQETTTSEEDARAARFCNWLAVEQGKEAKAKWSNKELKDATWLLENIDAADLSAAVRWGLTKEYWASKLTTSSGVRRWWDSKTSSLSAAWRASKNGGGSREDARAVRTRERMARGAGR